MNSLEPDITPVKKSVFKRLYELSLKKQELVATPEKRKEKAHKSKTPKEKIEISLLARHLKSQAKIYFKKVKRAESQSKLFTSVPAIDPLSKKLADATLSESQNDKTPKAVNLAAGLKKRLNSTSQMDSMVRPNDSFNYSDLKVDLSKFTVPKFKDNSSTFLKEITPKETSHGISYESITSRMQEFGSFTEETSPFNYYQSNSEIHNRTMMWNDHKVRKINLKRRVKVDNELKECSFTPDLSKNSRRVSFSYNSLPSTQPTSLKLAPSDLSLAYSTGLNLSAFMTKAKGMVNYKAVKK